MMTTLKANDWLLPNALMGSPVILDEILFDIQPIHEARCCVQDIFKSPMSPAVDQIEGILEMYNNNVVCGVTNMYHM